MQAAEASYLEGGLLATESSTILHSTVENTETLDTLGKALYSQPHSFCEPCLSSFTRFLSSLHGSLFRVIPCRRADVHFVKSRTLLFGSVSFLLGDIVQFS